VCADGTYWPFAHQNGVIAQLAWFLPITGFVPRARRHSLGRTATASGGDAGGSAQRGAQYYPETQVNNVQILPSNRQPAVPPSPRLFRITLPGWHAAAPIQEWQVHDTYDHHVLWARFLLWAVP